jgi:hypothetical protein
MGDFSQEILPISELDLDQINKRFDLINNLIRDFLAFIKVGSYVGNGARQRRYTGIGFTPKAVFIFVFISDKSEYHLINILTNSLTNKIIDDGFIIDDNGQNVNNNEKSITYYFIALG